MDKHVALTSCPFCGGEARLVNCGSPMVVCLHGCCQIVDDKNSVEHWNTRPIEDELRSEIDRLQAELKVTQERCDRYEENMARHGLVPVAGAPESEG
jgi:hypothetical protein